MRRREMATGAILSPGDAVGVVATGFAVRPRALAAGVEALRAMGLGILVGPSVLSRHGYLAGTDAERVADLNSALRDRRVRAVWFARGGYGSARILDEIDWAAFARDPKPLVGYSDVTAIMARALRHPRALCLHAPMVSELGDPRAFHRPSLRALLSGAPWSIPFGPSQVMRAGRVEGRLVGGNLNVLTHLLGTPHAPDFRGGVLFLEDVGEEVYRIDRMLTQLRASGALDQVVGVALGHFALPPRARSFPPDRPLLDVLRETFAPLGVPIVRGLPAGHRPGKRTLPLGARVRLDTRAGRLERLAAERGRRA